MVKFNPTNTEYLSTSRTMTWIKNYFLRHAQNCIGSLGNMTRQPVASAMTITVIGIALAMPSGLNVLVRNGQAVAGGWEDIRDFSVYLKPGSSDEDASQLRDKIIQLDIVESARLISADQALTELQSNTAFSEVLAALDDNPLPHTVVIRPNSEATPDALQDLHDELIATPIVDLVKLDTEWLQRLNAFLELARRAVWIAAVLLVGAVIVIIGNTIRLDIQNRRAQIEVAKLLGASDGFVRRPFLYTGFWYGLCGAVFALLLLSISLWVISGPAERLVKLYGGGVPADRCGSPYLAHDDCGRSAGRPWGRLDSR
jgi:cell division transport system permease protein